MAYRNNFPQGELESLEPSTVQEIVTSLKQLHDKGRPESDAEIKQRIDDYFSFCQHSTVRPGVESLCLALHISRTTLFNWHNGTNCSAKCQEYIQSAKLFISAFIEQSVLCGKISPPSGIFLMKNWCSYKDTISIEENMPNVNGNGKAVTAADFLHQVAALEALEVEDIDDEQ